MESGDVLRRLGEYSVCSWLSPTTAAADCGHTLGRGYRKKTNRKITMEGFRTKYDNTISGRLPKLVQNVCLTTCLAIDIGPTMMYNVYNDTIIPAKSCAQKSPCFQTAGDATSPFLIKKQNVYNHYIQF